MADLGTRSGSFAFHAFSKLDGAPLKIDDRSAIRVAIVNAKVVSSVRKLSDKSRTFVREFSRQKIFRSCRPRQRRIDHRRIVSLENLPRGTQRCLRRDTDNWIFFVKSEELLLSRGRSPRIEIGIPENRSDSARGSVPASRQLKRSYRAPDDYGSRCVSIFVSATDEIIISNANPVNEAAWEKRFATRGSRLATGL